MTRMTPETRMTPGLPVAEVVEILPVSLALRLFPRAVVYSGSG